MKDETGAEAVLLESAGMPNLNSLSLREVGGWVRKASSSSAVTSCLAW